MKILFVGGGSVGHIAPSVAVWEACTEAIPGMQCVFVCGERKEDGEFLRRNRLPFRTLNAPRASLLLPLTLLQAFRDASAILDIECPDIVFSKGGYVSLPLCIAAWWKRIPIVLHESDAVSGYANRIVRRFASAVCTGFPTRHRSLITQHTGNPVRKGITAGSREEGLRITGFSGNRPILLVMGGSQGALEINRCIAAMLDDLLLRCDVIHVTGRGKGTVEKKRDGYFQTEFAGDELAHLYACADIALTRAGAGSIAELAACGIPAILVPLRGVGHDHQYRNAVVAAREGGCIHLEQHVLQSRLLTAVHELVTDTERRTHMTSATRGFAKGDAALQIAKIIARTLDSSRGDQ